MLKFMSDKYEHDEYWRQKRIVMALQNALRQIHERKLADLSFFQYDFMIGADPWTAVDLEYFWKDLMPALLRIWKEEGRRGVVRKEYINSFVYPPKEVMWAISRFQDAYGGVFMKQVCWFQRCSCVDASGRRTPCVPPAVGFMCAKMCTVVKQVIVANKIRQERLWQDYMRDGIEDAVKRSKHEAESYLNSIDGRLWLTGLAYEKAEEMLSDKGAGDAVAWRTKLAEDRKRGVVRKYDRYKAKVIRVREKKAASINAMLQEAKEQFRVAREGYMKKTISAQIDSLTKMMASLPEHAELVRLQKRCEQECREVDEDIFGDNSTTESSSGVSSESDSANEDEETRERRNKRRAKQAKDRAFLEAARQEMAAHDAEMKKRAEEFEELLQVEEERRELERLGGVPKGSEIPLQLKKAKLNAIFFADKCSLPRNIENELRRTKLWKKFKRTMRNTRDAIDLRIRKFYRTFNGSFDEMQKELEHELYYQYINHHVALAKRKAEAEFSAIDHVRQNWEGIGLKLIFTDWKNYIATRKRRVRRDLRFYWRLAVRSFEAAMESVRIAEAQVAFWERCINVYTDEPFYRHTLTNQVTTDKPDIKHYLPAFFVIPAPPPRLPPEVSMETTSESEGGEGKKKQPSPQKDLPPEMQQGRQSVHERMARKAAQEYNTKIKAAKKRQEKDLGSTSHSMGGMSPAAAGSMHGTQHSQHPQQQLQTEEGEEGDQSDDEEDEEEEGESGDQEEEEEGDPRTWAGRSGSRPEDGPAAAATDTVTDTGTVGTSPSPSSHPSGSRSPARADSASARLVELVRQTVLSEGFREYRTQQQPGGAGPGEMNASTGLGGSGGGSLKRGRSTDSLGMCANPSSFPRAAPRTPTPGSGSGASPPDPTTHS